MDIIYLFVAVFVYGELLATLPLLQGEGCCLLSCPTSGFFDFQHSAFSVLAKLYSSTVLLCFRNPPWPLAACGFQNPQLANCCQSVTNRSRELPGMPPTVTAL